MNFPGHTCVLHSSGEYIIMYGGRNAEKERINDFHYLDIHSRVWSSMRCQTSESTMVTEVSSTASVHPARQGELVDLGHRDFHVSVAYKNSMLSFGGSDGEVRMCVIETIEYE